MASRDRTPVKDLQAMLRGMSAIRVPGEFAYVVLPDGALEPAVPVHATVQEAEGKTLVMKASDAETLGWPIRFRGAWITLQVFSDLEACGLTAAVSRVLADAGIACNVIAGTHHDHVLVPVDDAERALAALARLQAEADIKPEACANCGQNLSGAYCADCGQARFVEADRRLSHLLRQFFDNLTSLDSRFWRSLIALLCRPGVMTRDYLDGRRARWMSPVALFLLGNVLYFFSPRITDFDLPFLDQVPGSIAIEMLDPGHTFDEAQRERIRANTGQWHSPWTAFWVTDLVDEKNRAAESQSPPQRYTVTELAHEYDAVSSDVSKLLIILHVPMMALILMFLLWPLRRYFAEHMVVSLHVFGFLLFVMVLVPWLTQALTWAMARAPALDVALRPWAGAGFFLAVILVPIIYSAITLRRALSLPWRQAIPVAIILFIGLFLSNMLVYRFLQFAIVLAMI